MRHCLLLCIFPALGILVPGALGLQDNNTCGIGWVLILKRCYHFSRGEESWPAAVTHCKALNARLAEIETPEEDTYLRIYMEDHISPVHSYWIGGTDELQEHYWVWISDNQVINYSNWIPGEPNGGDGENCLETAGVRNYKWNDNSCNRNLRFICEK